MKVVDPGHIYLLNCLDGGGQEPLKFVKRMGEKYPGNKSAYPGTNIQEVMRALIDRLDYVHKQVPCNDNRSARHHLQMAMWFLEKRAAKRHGRELETPAFGIELLPTCPKCGHVECEGHRRTIGN